MTRNFVVVAVVAVVVVVAWVVLPLVLAAQIAVAHSPL